MAYSKAVLVVTCLVLAPVLLLCVAVSAQQGPRIRTLTEQEMVDMMQGSSIQASRSAATAPTIKQVHDAFAQGKRYTMVSLDEVPDTWNIVVPTGVGGGGAWEYVIERVKKQNLPTVTDGQGRAVEALAKYVGKKVDALIRFEGAASTLQTFNAAAYLGVPVIDACPIGRSVPEIEQQLTYIHGIPMTPATGVTRWGDVIIIDRAADGFRVEDIFRAVAVASGGGMSEAQSMMSGKDAKASVIKGAVSNAIAWGRALREAREQGKDPIAALLKAAGGHKLFYGIVTKADTKGDRGFTWRDVELKGLNEYSGHTYKLYVKNENIVAWLDGVVDAMMPDLICNLDPKTGDTIFGEGLGAYPMNAEVVMVGIPNSPLLRTPKALEIVGPRHFGFDFDYRSLEEIHKFGARDE
jgi:DUF917 family protein